MAEIVLKTTKLDKAVEILIDALKTEGSRLKYNLRLAKNRLKRFEKKYNVSSEIFIKNWGAENLKGEDMEYVEWAGEYQLSLRLNERLVTLKSIEHVTS